MTFTFSNDSIVDHNLGDCKMTCTKDPDQFFSSGLGTENWIEFNLGKRRVIKSVTLYINNINNEGLGSMRFTTTVVAKAFKSKFLIS